MTELDFQKQVIDRSYDVPVLVDFWASWCEPCKYLGPMLEKLESESNGKWLLIKVNLEEDMELAEQFRIRSIPSLKLFHKGTEIAALNGALPERELIRWLDKNLPDQVHIEWNALLNEMDPEDLFFPNYRIQEFVSHYRNFEEAALYLALTRAATEPQFAYTVLARIHPKPEFLDLRDDIQALADFFSLSETEKRVSQILQLSADRIRKRNFQEGLDLLIQAVMLDKTFADEVPRRAGIAIFRILGHDHPLTQKYRKRFDMALY